MFLVARPVFEGNQNKLLMKKHLLFFAFAALLSPTLSAQFSLAVQGGIQSSRHVYSGEFFQIIPGASTNPPRFLAGYHIGLVPAFKAESGKIEVFVPLSFVERQFQFGPEVPDTPISRDRFRSLELNPRIGIFIGPDFSVLAGMYGSYIVQTHVNHNEDGWSVVPDWIRKQLYNSFEVGFTGGLRYAVNRFHIYGNVQYGLSPLLDMQFTDVNGEPLDKFSGRNLAFQLGLGYTIISGK
jgi:hypothetical protein